MPWTLGMLKATATFSEIGENVSWVNIYNDHKSGWHYSSLLCWSLSNCSLAWQKSEQSYTPNCPQQRPGKRILWKHLRPPHKPKKDKKNIYGVIHRRGEQGVIQSSLFLFQGILLKPVQKELCPAFTSKIRIAGYLKSSPVEALQCLWWVECWTLTFKVPSKGNSVSGRHSCMSPRDLAHFLPAFAGVWRVAGHSAGSPGASSSLLPGSLVSAKAGETAGRGSLFM